MDFINTFLARAWPFYNRALQTVIRQAVEPLLEVGRRWYTRNVIRGVHEQCTWFTADSTHHQGLCIWYTTCL